MDEALETKTSELQKLQPSVVIQIINLKKSFGENNHVLNGFNLNVLKGENVVILGKSGSGKSVAIKCIVGLLPIDDGDIIVFDKNIATITKKELNTIRIRIGFLFQNSALYDSMSVRENLEFPLRRHVSNISDAEVEQRVKDTLQSVGLVEAIDKTPAELSGGMRKRIGLARTLILHPEIILYDEPTTGLDSITSREISELLVSIQKKYKTTSIMITHDMACAKITSNKIAIIKDGMIYAQGTYAELEQSKDEWVQAFFK
jgi:phospholipid/cholesterol/gamma-HCH transport system ATP-binding protein